MLKTHYRIEAAEQLRGVLGNVEMVSGDQVEQAAIDMFFHFRDKTWSVVDCANFVAIQRRNCPQAFAFDQHFRQAGGQFGFKLLI